MESHPPLNHNKLLILFRVLIILTRQRFPTLYRKLKITWLVLLTWIMYSDKCLVFMFGSFSKSVIFEFGVGPNTAWVCLERASRNEQVSNCRRISRGTILSKCHAFCLIDSITSLANSADDFWLCGTSWELLCPSLALKRWNLLHSVGDERLPFCLWASIYCAGLW